MSAKRVFLIMIAVVVLLGGSLVASVVFGNKMLEQKAKKLTELKLENKSLDEQQVALTQTNKSINEYIELEKVAKAVVPQEKDQAATVREIVKIADENDINLSSITFPASTLGQPAPKPVAPSDDNKATSGNGSSNGAEATPKPAAPAAPAVTQVKAVDGIAGVYVMEIVIQSDTTKPISYNRFINFLDDLEQNRRTAQVSNINVKPNVGDRSRLTFGLTLNVYLKP